MRIFSLTFSALCFLLLIRLMSFSVHISIFSDSTIKPVFGTSNTSCDGTTFTDTFNCALPATLGTYIKFGDLEIMKKFVHEKVHEKVCS